MSQSYMSMTQISALKQRVAILTSEVEKLRKLVEQQQKFIDMFMAGKPYR